MISALRQKSNFEFQTFLKKNSNFRLSSSSKVKFLTFFKKIQIFGFPWCSIRADLSIDASITNVGLILTKLRGFLFSGCGQTDGRTDTRFWNRHMELETCRNKKFQLKAQN